MAIAAVTSRLARGYDSSTLLEDIAARAAACLDATGAAVVAATRGDAIHVVASYPGMLDPLSSSVLVGRAVSRSINLGVMVSLDDLEAPTPRWLAVSVPDAPDGVRSMRIYPIANAGRPLGALIVHAADAWGNSRPTMTGQTMADLAGIVLSTPLALPADDTAHTLRLVADRAIINRAYGMVAEANSISVDEAARLLQRQARAARRLTAVLARQVVDDPALARVLGSVAAQAAPVRQPPESD